MEQEEESRHAGINALALNRAYQSLLKLYLKRIEQSQHRNQELQRKIRVIITQNNKLKKNGTTGSGKRPGSAYFVDVDGSRPPENPDTKRKNLQLQKLPLVFKCKKWNENEIKNLAKGVRQQKQQYLVDQLMDQFKRSTHANLEDYNREMEKIRNLTDTELETAVTFIDWDRLAKQHVPTRSGTDCRLRWHAVDDPLINKDPWTNEEDKKLLALAKKHLGHDWVSIAKELGTNRTAVQCFTRYQRSLNVNMLKGKWSEEEDKILTEAVQQFGDKNWQQVAHCLDGRTGQQCLHRWQKTLNPNIRRGRWKREEDKMLELAVKAYGYPQWVKIQQHVPGRTDVQCRERWMNILNPALKSGPWTPEEDAQLLEAVNQYGVGKWSKVAEILRHRTDNQCWRRYRLLQSEQVEQYKSSVSKKRKGLVNNFVGREKERPTLTVEDFELDSSPSEEDHRKQPKRRTSVRVRKSSKKRRSSGMESPSPDLHNSKDPIEDNNDISNSHDEDLDDHVSPSIPTLSVTIMNETVLLPLVLPSPISWSAAARLMDSLGRLNPSQQVVSKNSPVFKCVNTPEFQVLAGWFNSLFFCSMWLWADAQRRSNQSQLPPH